MKPDSIFKQSSKVLEFEKNVSKLVGAIFKT
jgi:hypothetical protein